MKYLANQRLKAEKHTKKMYRQAETIAQIYIYIYQLLQENKTQKFDKYVALDLSKLPLIHYESLDVTGLLLSHKKLEAEVFDLKDRIKDCTKLITEVTSNQSALTEVYTSLSFFK